MKVSALVAPAPGAASPSSARASSDGPDGQDFEAVLGDIAPRSVEQAGAAAATAGARAPVDLRGLAARAVDRSGSGSSLPSSIDSPPRSIPAQSIPARLIRVLSTRDAAPRDPSAPSGQDDAGPSEDGLAKRKRSTDGEDGAPGSADGTVAAAPAQAIGLIAAAAISAAAVAPPADHQASARTDDPAPPGRSVPDAAPASPASAPPEAAGASSIAPSIVAGSVRIATHLGFGAGESRAPEGAETVSAGSGSAAHGAAESQLSAELAPPAAHDAPADGGDRQGPGSHPDAAAHSESAASAASGTDAPGDAAPVSSTSVTSPAVASMAAPVPLGAPPVVRQVAEAVVSLAANPGQEERGTPVAPARTMALQLAPAGLGTLTVHLRMTGRALDLRLDVQDARTAALIDRDRDALSGALRGEDLKLRSLVVTTHDTTMPGGTHAGRGTETGSQSSRTPDQPRDAGGAGGQASGQASAKDNGRGSRETRGRGTARKPADDARVERGDASLFV